MKSLYLKHGTLLYDEDDAELIESYNWYSLVEGNTVYARTNVACSHCKSGKTTRALHRFLRPECAEVDHKNRNGLDNTRENLRCATRSENSRNRQKRKGSSSRFKGVSWDKGKQLWHAYIGGCGSDCMISLGFYKTEQAAALAYDRAARLSHGAFAVMNFPRIGERGLDGKVRGK